MWYPATECCSRDSQLLFKHKLWPKCPAHTEIIYQQWWGNSHYLLPLKGLIGTAILTASEPTCESGFLVQTIKVFTCEPNACKSVFLLSSGEKSAIPRSLVGFPQTIL